MMSGGDPAFLEIVVGIIQDAMSIGSSNAE
jgi:hypothetical protein